VAIKTLIDGTPSENIIQELRKQSPTLTRLNDDFRYLHADLEILTIFELEDTPSLFETPDGEWRHDDFGRTALHLTAEWCSSETVQLLLQAGGRIETMDHDRWASILLVQIC
jgi:ankyrin repeat protein